MSQSHFWNLLAKKLAGEASAEELQQVEDLLRSNPEWAYQAEHLQNLWQQAPPQNLHESELAFAQHLVKMKEGGLALPEPDSTLDIPKRAVKGSRKKTRMLLLSMAAPILLVFAGMFWLNNRRSAPAHPEKNYSEISAPPGSKTKLVLPDSTVVWLNAGSRLTYNEHFGSTNRNTTLTGEAFFDVKKSTVPFIIHANAVQIRVLGTAFNVKAYPGEKTVETSLLRGRVEITLDRRPGEKFILKPDEKLVVANDQEESKINAGQKHAFFALKEGLTRTEDSTIIETSWVENKLIFRDESFSEIATRMERWYGVNIDFKDANVAEERMSGTFTLETIQEALAALQISTKFHYSIKGNIITITQ